MKHYENFYKNGFEIFKFDSCGIDDILKDISNGVIKNGFSLQQKYSSTVDLRPNVIDYSEKFLDILKKNNIKSFIKSRTLRDLTLHHIQVRVADSTVSYMNWHRDSYYDDGKNVGMTPPGYKIIYYPGFNEKKKPRLHVAPGSHRIMIDKQSEDLKLVSRLNKFTVETSNDHALFFETSLLHAVVPDELNSPSIRLIYSFLSKEQLMDYSTDELHVRTSKAYEEIK
jgi:hypothetical protein